MDETEQGGTQTLMGKQSAQPRRYSTVASNRSNQPNLQFTDTIVVTDNAPQTVKIAGRS